MLKQVFNSVQQCSTCLVSTMEPPCPSFKLPSSEQSSRRYPPATRLASHGRLFGQMTAFSTCTEECSLLAPAGEAFAVANAPPEVAGSPTQELSVAVGTFEHCVNTSLP